MNNTTASITSASPKALVVTVALSLGALTALVLGGSQQANAQAAASVATPSSTAVSLHDGVDWSRVAVVPASPAQSVAAYDR